MGFPFSFLASRISVLYFSISVLTVPLGMLYAAVYPFVFGACHTHVLVLTAFLLACHGAEPEGILFIKALNV